MNKMTPRKMTFATLICLILFLLPIVSIPNVEARLTTSKKAMALSDIEPQWTCVACTMIVGLVSQLAEMHNVKSKKAAEIFCGFFPLGDALLCDLVTIFLWGKAFALIDNKESPDSVCQALSYCTNAKCHLFPESKPSMWDVAAHLKRLRMPNSPIPAQRKVPLCAYFPLLCQGDGETIPKSDNDGDLFSTVPKNRGTDWRGRDCNDKDDSTYPGRDTLDLIKDENCNGIFGYNTTTGASYEASWCTNSSAMGVITIGDSFAAHFGIPEGLLNVSQISTAVVAQLSDIIKNEFDWPMLSAFTGFADPNTYAPDRSGSMISVYSEFVKRNRCNHRDYQNLGINGATTYKLLSMMSGVKRSKADGVKPAMVFFSLIGNDVCALTPTSPSSYYQNILQALDMAETLLPNGSIVILLPIADGSVLYNTMHDRIHPVGSLHNDVTYANFYDFLNCLDISPCPGWMNTNETIRMNTKKAADSLNSQIPNILSTAASKYKSIRVYNLGDAISNVLKNYKGPIWELIEPVDGFHPSQHATALIAQYYIDKLEEYNILPPLNPFNEAIKEKFGDQGGY